MGRDLCGDPAVPGAAVGDLQFPHQYVTQAGPQVQPRPGVWRRPGPPQDFPGRVCGVSGDHISRCGGGIAPISGTIEPFSSLVRNLVGDRKSLTCTDSGACAYSHLNVLPDGSASHCGRSADWGLLDYGSIRDKSFSQIFSDPQREILPAAQCRPAGNRVQGTAGFGISATEAAPWMPGSRRGRFSIRAAGASRRKS